MNRGMNESPCQVPLETGNMRESPALVLLSLFQPHWVNGVWGRQPYLFRWAVIPGRMEEEAPGEGKSWVRGSLRRKT